MGCSDGWALLRKFPVVISRIIRAPLHQWTRMTRYHRINAHVDMVEQRSSPSRRRRLVLRITRITKVVIKDTCIIGACFPCRGLRESEAEFEDTLMQVAEICSKCIDTHFITVAADFNADLISSASRSDKDKRSMGLSLFDCPAQPTFYYHSDLGQSQVDYIIGSYDLDIHINIHDRDPCNTSSHMPVTTTLQTRMSCSQSSTGDDSLPSNAPKPRCDLIEPLTHKFTVLETPDGDLEISLLKRYWSYH